MRTLRFEDTQGNTHYVNADYIVQFHTSRVPDWDRSGRKVGEHTVYYVNVANAGVACYNAADIEVSEETFNTLIDK